MIAALADGPTRLTNALFSDDSLYFANALKDLGFHIDLNLEKKEIVVTGCSGEIPVKKAELFIGNAGTAARFLSSFLTLGNGEYTLDGDARMRERPIGDLISSLTQLGANISPLSQAHQNPIGLCPPVKIVASGLPGGRTSVNGDISSQFLSALLMVAPYAQTPVEISVSTELNSKPYVDMTLGVMADFGISIQRSEYQNFYVSRGSYRSLKNYVIEPDASAASYFFAAPAILGGKIRIENISLESKQGDIAFLNVLKAMGCTVHTDTNYIEVIGPCSISNLKGVDIDMRDIPDTAQTLAVIAPFASSPTHIHGIASARMKESDRVSATCAELTRMGVKVEEFNDGMSIYPCDKFTPAQIRTYQDHRMAMAFALMGLKISGVRIENPGCVSKTFPEYFEVLDGLRC